MQVAPQCLNQQVPSVGRSSDDELPTCVAQSYQFGANPVEADRILVRLKVRAIPEPAGSLVWYD
jgi:hypothetical protein